MRHSDLLLQVSEEEAGESLRTPHFCLLVSQSLNNLLPLVYRTQPGNTMSLRVRAEPASDHGLIIYHCIYENSFQI